MKTDFEKLRALSKEVQREILNLAYQSKSGHLGSNLSVVDILLMLYFKILNINPKKTSWEARDRFLLSKGHAALALYTILSKRGFFPKSYLSTYLQNGSKLAGHTTLGSLPGIEATSGSLGHSLSIGVGMSLAIKHKKLPSKIYVLIGDGESQEGSIWEAINFAGHHRINNLVLIIDANNLQIMGKCTDILNSFPFEKKIESFGWDVKSVNGHDFNALFNALKPHTNHKPQAVIAHTIKGKGVTFMENRVEWHGKSLNEEEYKLAIKELT